MIINQSEFLTGKVITISRNIAAYFSFLFCLAACQDSSLTDSPPINDSGNMAVTEIRIDTTKSSDFQNALIVGRQLKLNSLQSGFDSLEIRIWYDFSLEINKKMLQIQRRNGNWKAFLYTSKIRYSHYRYYHSVVSFNKRSVFPTNGWNELISNLGELKIQQLSDEPRAGADGRTFSVEIATKHKYIFYSFWEPGFYKNDDWKCNNMAQIIDLLALEFKLENLNSAVE